MSEAQQEDYTHYDSTDDGKKAGGDVTSNAFADLIALLRAGQNAQRRAWIRQAQARPTSEDYMRAIQNRLGQFPTLCGPAGVFAYAGYGSKGGVGADVLIEYDGKTGLSAGPLLEAGHGGVAGGGAATVGKGGLHGEGLVFVGEEAGVFSTVSKTPQIGPYLGASIPGTGIGAGIGAYATLTSVAGCHN